MPVHEFIIRYREYSKAPGTWDEALFSLDDWPDGNLRLADRVEDHPEAPQKWFSIHFLFEYPTGMTYDELRVQAKQHARTAFLKNHPGAKLY